MFLGAFCFFFSFDATAQQRLDGFSPVSTNRRLCGVILLMFLWYPMKIAPPAKGAQNVHFWSENSDSAVFRRPLHENEEEFWEN